MKIQTGLLMMATALLSLNANAAPPQWTIDPASSQLRFTGTQNGAPVSGQFKTFSGDIVFDANNLKDSHLTIKIDMNSINASFAELKETLIAPDWFNVKLFPYATFKAAQFEKAGAKNYIAHGTLTIRDKTAPVDLRFSIDNVSSNKSVVVGETILKRRLFGVGQGEWASVDEIKDDVRIQFNVQATKK